MRRGKQADGPSTGLWRSPLAHFAGRIRVSAPAFSGEAPPIPTCSSNRMLPCRYLLQVLVEEIGDHARDLIAAGVDGAVYAGKAVPGVLHQDEHHRHPSFR